MLALLVAVVVLLHQDIWLWTNRTLVFGFLPAGLAYHAGYSVLAALTMALLVRYLWPAHLEEEDSVTVPTATAADEGRRP
jgi:hypothetical protein